MHPGVAPDKGSVFMNKKKKTLAGGPARYLYLLPALVIYCSVVVYPVLYSLYLSFFKWNGIAPVKKFVGLKNYIDLFTKDSVFMTALRNNVLWIVLTMVFTVSLALLFAVILNMKFRGRTVVRGILYFPYTLSGVIVAVTWQWIYHPQLGLLNNFLEAIGKSEWMFPVLAETKTAFVAVFIAGLWHYIGQPMILFLAGLATIPRELVEAAHIDGANNVQSFFHITLPLLKETTLIVFATQIISSMKVYDIVYAMTGGGPAQSTQTLATWMVTQTFTFTKLGTGTAIAWIMVLISSVIVVPYVIYQARH